MDKYSQRLGDLFTEARILLKIIPMALSNKVLFLVMLHVHSKLSWRSVSVPLLSRALGSPFASSSIAKARGKKDGEHIGSDTNILLTIARHVAPLTFK